MAAVLMAWLSARAPTTWTSTTPACRTAPAIAPATEFGLDLVETLRVSIGAPRWAVVARTKCCGVPDRDSTPGGPLPSAGRYPLFLLAALRALGGGAGRPLIPSV